MLSIIYGGREKVSPYTLSGGNLRGVVDDIYGTGIIIEQSHITDILHLLSAAPEYIPACHTFGHELGHESLDLYGFVGAFSQVSDADTGMNNCISGYLHGIIEHSITKNPKLLEDPETICSGFSDDSVYARNCAHGIGHGTMIIEKRHVDRSIAICADLTGVRARDECYG